MVVVVVVGWWLGGGGEAGVEPGGGGGGHCLIDGRYLLQTTAPAFRHRPPLSLFLPPPIFEGH